MVEVYSLKQRRREIIVPEGNVSIGLHCCLRDNGSCGIRHVKHELFSKDGPFLLFLTPGFQWKILVSGAQLLEGYFL